MNIIIFPPLSIENNDFNFKNKTTKRTIKNKTIFAPRIKKKRRSIKNNRYLTLQKIIFSILAILLIGIICLIVCLVVKKIKNKKISRKPFEEMSGSPLKTFENPDLNSLVKLDFNQLVQNITYKESEKLLDLELIRENNILLNESKEYINNIFINIENPNDKFVQINSEIIYNPPDLLKNPTKASLKIVKSDLELYKRKYEELKEKVNNFTDILIQSFKNLFSPINNTRNELNTISSQFEKRIKDLFTILVLQQNGLKNVNTRKLDEELNNYYEDNSFSYNRPEEFKNEINELNKLYNISFTYINKVTKIINNEIIDISNEAQELKNKIEEGIYKYEQILQKFTEQEDIQKYHKNLIEIKQSFLSIKDSINKKKNNLGERLNNLENKYQDNIYNFEELENDIEKVEENLNNISNSISEDVNDVIEKYSLNPIDIPELKASNIIINLIVNSLDRIFNCIKTEHIEIINGMKVIESIINVEEQTSLDLLFIMDITLSMGPYLDQAKENVINIINTIPLECPGIDINLGFIGYRDEPDFKDYVNIDFTQNYQQLQNTIKKAYISDGYDYPEDVSGAFELALNKNWKSNSKFAILVGDAPCHGNKYHNFKEFFPNGTPERRNIEDLINDLAGRNISLFCMKITEYTNIMFSTFESIYNKYNKCQFSVVSMSSPQDLSDIVVNSAADVYINQRNKQI